MSSELNFNDHSRLFNNFKYVYPVLSRRSGGVSLGINLNLDNTCNWRCIYCQVPNLVRGKPVEPDLNVLESELNTMLEWIVHGNFLAENAPAKLDRFTDICIAGNGEPTLSGSFLMVCRLIQTYREKYSLNNSSTIKTILITNGSQMSNQLVQDGIEIIARNNGEVWFKIDRATVDGINKINQVNLSLDNIKKSLTICAKKCTTYIQSCWFKTSGQQPDTAEINAFIEFMLSIQHLISGVLLYSTARKPQLDEGKFITQISDSFLKKMSDNLEKHGIVAKYYR